MLELTGKDLWIEGKRDFMEYKNNQLLSKYFFNTPIALPRKSKDSLIITMFSKNKLLKIVSGHLSENPSDNESSKNHKSIFRTMLRQTLVCRLIALRNKQF